MAVNPNIKFSDNLLGHELEFTSTWGLFSPEKVDDGSKLLLGSMRQVPNARILDLGCGYGPIGLALAKTWPGAKVEMVDKDFVAVQHAQANAEINHLPNAGAYLSNGFDQVITPQFDVIVSNLPAKVSSELYQIWFEQVNERLVPGGVFYVVTISGLRQYIKRTFTEAFGNYDKLAQSKTYTAASATIKP